MSEVPDGHPKRIVHVVHKMVVGGIETLVLDLMRRDDGTRHECVSLTLDKQTILASWPVMIAMQDRLYCVEKGEGLEPFAVLRLASLFRRLRPDAVVLHHIGPFLYAGLAARLAKVPVIIHYEHDAWHYEIPNNRRIATTCSHLVRPIHVAVSESVASGMRPVVGKAPVQVIAPGIDTDCFVCADRGEARKRLGIDPQKRWIGTVGRLVAVKNQASLIEALALLDNEHAVLIVGDGPERPRLEVLTETLNLSNRVCFLGERSDIHKIIPALDVFCLPSLNEGLPRSVLEAQSCGVPVVTTTVGSLAEAVHAESGALVAPDNAAELADAIKLVLARACDPAALRRHVIDRFSITAVARELERFVTARSGNTGLLTPGLAL